MVSKPTSRFGACIFAAKKTKKNSKYNMDVTEWGPCAWKFLHAVSFASPKSPSPVEQQMYRTFFNDIANILPCALCKKHYQEFLHEHPVETQSRESLTRWLVEAHNSVNVRTGKPIMPYEAVCMKYSYTHPPYPKKSSSVFLGLKIVCILAVIITIVICIGLLVMSCVSGRCPIVK